MPKIPTYGGQQVNEAPLRAPMNPTEAPLEAFGGGRAAAETFGAAANIGQGIEQIAGQEYRKQYQDAVNQQSMEAANKLLAEQTRLKMSMANLSGPDAQKATGSVMGDYEKFYQNLEKDLQNSDVRKNVYGHYLSTQGQLNEWAQHTAYAKMREWDQDTFLARGKTLVDSVSVDPSMPNLSAAVERRKIDIRNFAASFNKPQEWVQASEDEASSKLHLTALQALVRGNDMAASAFYKLNHDEFKGHDAQVAAELVKASDYRGTAQRETMRIFAGVAPEGEGPPKPPTEKETYAEVDKIEDPTLQDMVRQRVEHRWMEIRRIQENALKQDTTDASNLIEANPSLDAVPVELYERLPTATRKYLVTRIAQIKKGLGPQPVSDNYLSYVREAATEPDTFVKRNFAAMRDEITDEEAKELTKEQASIMNGDERMARKRGGFLTVEKIGRERMRALSMDDEKDKEQFMSALDRDYWTWRNDPKNEGAAINPVDAENLVNMLLYREPRWWKPGKYILRKIEDVPEADRISIAAELRKAGEAPTEGRIIDVYKRANK